TSRKPAPPTVVDQACPGNHNLLAVGSSGDRESARVLGHDPAARRQTFRRLEMHATVAGGEFFGLQHGDGRLNLIESLAAAYRAGELPEYTLEFVDSLRTRATPDTS